MIVQELYRAPWKPMPSGRTRLDSTGVWRLDYARGNFAGAPDTPVEVAFADIPDADGNDPVAPAELVHFAGWAYGRPVFVWHRQLAGDAGYALMLGVGVKQADATWFVGAGAAPVQGGGMDEATLRRVVQEEVAKAVAGLPQQVFQTLIDTPNAPDHYGLAANLQSSKQLQEWLTYPVLQAVKWCLTDPTFLRNEVVPALDAATKP